MTVRHLLLTRFNLRVTGWTRDTSGRPVLGPEWMRERLQLFERYCVPSVAAQTQRDVTWLVFIDQETDPDDRARIEATLAAVPDARIIALPPVDGDGPVAAAALEAVGDPPDVLLSTRLDNDDALHERALETIRARMRPGVREFLNLRLGWVTDGVTAQVRSHKYGHFTTLVEPRAAGPFRTVWCGLPHGRARRFAPFRQIADQPYWLEVIHGRNAANRTPWEPRTYDFGTLRGLQRWLRFEVLRPARRRFWPAEYRRPRPLEEIVGPFNVDSADSPGTVR